jgi:hypothetical protein
MKREDAPDLPSDVQPTAVDEIAAALLYEGYLLYPYRRSALKNRYRWVFGVLVPRDYSRAVGETEPWVMQTECLLKGEPDAILQVRVRFLHLAAPATAPMLSPHPAVDETAQREVVVEEEVRHLHGTGREFPFRFPPQDGDRTENGYRHVEGRLELSVQPTEGNVLRLTVRVENCTPVDSREQPGRGEVLHQCLISTHAILSLRQGEFFSLCDPPPALRDAAAACCNRATWPVLVGAEGRRDAMLSAPIILYDYPRVAPESPGDFFDGTEVDELLTLRVLTLTEEEKREVRAAGDRARALLDRTERLTAEKLLRLHGAVRDRAPAVIRPGARVRLRPRGRSDAMDLILSGKAATVVSVERDYEGRVHLAVTVDDDPGQDLGRQGQPGHRFFFRPEEVEPLMPASEEAP